MNSSCSTTPSVRIEHTNCSEKQWSILSTEDSVRYIQSQHAFGCRDEEKCMLNYQAIRLQLLLAIVFFFALSLSCCYFSQIHRSPKHWMLWKVSYRPIRLSHRTLQMTAVKFTWKQNSCFVLPEFSPCMCVLQTPIRIWARFILCHHISYSVVLCGISLHPHFMSCHVNGR